MRVCQKGMIFGILGPALSDLTFGLNTTTDEISFMFLCFAFGYTMGSIISLYHINYSWTYLVIMAKIIYLKDGIIFNYINRQLVLVCLLVLMGVTIAGLPFSPNKTVLFIIAFLCGYGNGGLHTVFPNYYTNFKTQHNH